MFRYLSYLTLATAMAGVTAFTNHYVSSPPGKMTHLFVSGMIDLDDSNYVKLLNSDTATLVDACATWCGPCKLIEPVLEKCAEKWAGKIEMAKFDVEQKNPNLKLEMLLQEVMPKSLPSLILFHEGTAIGKHNGVITEEELDEFLKTNLSAVASSSTSSKSKEPSVEQKQMKKAGYISFGNDGDDYMLSGLA